mmetsp:Transcript_85839/g.135550  ORF Transcript_85839/g.135550 Transcript_85839/m.135550 type:complete len:100 (-) Transcript_85839:176-475(-)
MQPWRTLCMVLMLFFMTMVESSLVSPLGQARHFLRTHASTAPKEDELARLQDESPEAYEIVKALLGKNSLGLSGDVTSFAQESIKTATGFARMEERAFR